MSPHREQFDPTGYASTPDRGRLRDLREEEIVTKLPVGELDGLAEQAAQAEDVSARGASRSLLSLHGGSEDGGLPELPEERAARLGGEA